MRPNIGIVFCIITLFSQSIFAQNLELTENKDVIKITLHGKPVLEYVKTEKPVPEGLSEAYQRSGYIHPVYTPTGEEITGDFPRDHAHQHALFFAWTKSTFDGKKVDFWNQAKKLAGIEFREVLDVKREEKQVSFSVKHAFTVGKGKDKVDAIEEIWTVTVHQTPADHFLFDIKSVQKCASDKPLTLEEYHYGGMAFRGNAQWLKDKNDKTIDPGDLEFLTSEGKDRWSGNHTQPNWVSLTGKLDDQDVSLSVFCHPKNFRAPQHVRLHPSKPYFCFAPSVAGKFTIEPGQEYVSQYRYLVQSKTTDESVVNEHWKQYSASTEK